MRPIIALYQVAIDESVSLDDRYTAARMMRACRPVFSKHRSDQIDPEVRKIIRRTKERRNLKQKVIR